MTMTLDALSVAILQALAQDQPLANLAGGGWRLGRRRVSQGDMAALAARELVARNGDAWRLTAPGRAALARAEAGKDGAYAQNRLLTEEMRRLDGEDRRVEVNLAESPLGWLMRRKLLNRDQFDAGERLRDDFERAQLAPRITMRWDAGPGENRRRAAPHPLDPTSSQIAAKARVEGALEAVGPGLEDILWRVVCGGEGLETAEKALAWPPRSAKLVLGLALDRLAAYYQGNGKKHYNRKKAIDQRPAL